MLTGWWWVADHRGAGLERREVWLHRAGCGWATSALVAEMARLTGGD